MKAAFFGLTAGTVVALAGVLAAQSARTDRFETARAEDCHYAIAKIVKAEGEVHPWTQWTSYSKWTHQGQCSEELAKL